MSIRMNHLFYRGKSLALCLLSKRIASYSRPSNSVRTTHGLEVGKAISAGWDSLYSFVGYKVGMVLA